MFMIQKILIALLIEFIIANYNKENKMLGYLGRSVGKASDCSSGHALH